MNLTRTDSNGVTTIKVEGDLDLYTASDLRSLLGVLAEIGRLRIVLDLDGCTFMDSTGLVVILGAVKRCRNRGGEMAIACTSEPALQAFRITELTRVLTICDTVDLAVAALGKEAGQ